MSSNTFSRIEQFALLFIFLVFFFTIGPWWDVYEFNTDEGLNLQKAALFANGHDLYTEIWNDQPPFFTYILSIVHNIIPFSVSVARSTVLLFSFILFISLFRVVNRYEGRIAAWATVLILISGKLYLSLSVSVLIGLPAIALTMLAIDILSTESGYPFRARVILSGIVFAFAVTTKFFVLIVLPSVLLTAVIAPRYYKERIPIVRRKAESIALFIGSLSLFIFMVFLIAGDFNTGQLLGPHITASNINKFSGVGGIQKLIQYLQEDSTAAFYFGVAGVLLLFIRPNVSRLIPLTWLVIGFIVYSFHRPLWSHHLLLLVIPLSWFGGIAIVNTIRSALYITTYLRGHLQGQHTYHVIFFMTFLVLLSTLSEKNIEESHRRFSRNPSVTDQLVQSRLELFKTNSEYIVTDRPIDAYRFGKLVPPELAVWSSKRVKTGNLTNEDVLKNITTFNTAQISLRRFNYKDQFLKKIINKQYRPIGLTAVSRQKIRVLHFIPYDGVENTELTPNNNNLNLKHNNHIDNDTRIVIRNLFMQLSLLGTNGIGGVYDRENRQRFDRIQSKKPLKRLRVVTRPPGSAQELGACFLEFWKKTSESVFLIEAVHIAGALACTQTKGGGWTKVGRLPRSSCPPRDGNIQLQHLVDDSEATFDDGTSTSALYYALDLRDTLLADGLDPPRWLEQMIRRGLGFIINKQNADGGWRQSLDPDKYHSLVTLNDDVLTGLTRLLIHVFKLNGNRKYLNAAIKAGNYLLSVQGPGSQPAFAQQYSPDGQPSAARKFEPAAYSSLETAYAINTLIDLYLVSEDENYRVAATKAADWLIRSQLSEGTWARFYEIGTNKAIYSDRAGNKLYSFEDIPVDEQMSYRWLGGQNIFPDIKSAIDRSRLMEDDLLAITLYDQALNQNFLLPQVATARIPFIKKIRPDYQGSLISTRQFVEDCASSLAQFNSNFPTSEESLE